MTNLKNYQILPKLIRITTVPISLDLLLTGQMKYMNENGFEVLMISDDGKERDKVMEQESCNHIVVSMTREITPIKDLHCLWVLIRLFRREKPDIVHSHTPKAGLLGMLAARIAGVPVKIHTIAGLRFMTTVGFKRKLLVGMEKLTYYFADCVWANSFSIANYLKEHKLIDGNKLGIIGKGSTNGIDLQRFSKSALKIQEIEATKKLINYDEKNFYLLSVGRMVKDKGIEELIEVFEIIKKEVSHLRLILVGPFEEQLDGIRADIKETIQNDKDIIHINWSNQVEYFMHLANILVHPSHREGFPNVLLQAGAMECSIICSDIAGNIDIVQHQETGILFKVSDKKDLESKLIFGIKNTENLLKFKEKLLSDIKEKFDRKMVHQSILNQYIRLVKNK
jgi:glycosyltransferase involved in cell wall biosynthesis